MSAAELDAVRTAMLASIADALDITAGLARDLAEKADKTAGSTSADLRNSVEQLRVELGALDGLGWPDEDGNGR